MKPAVDYETTLHTIGPDEIGLVIKVQPDRDFWIESGTFADIEMGAHRMEPEAILELLLKVATSMVPDVVEHLESKEVPS